MNLSLYTKKQRLIHLATQEGKLCLKGNDAKAGPDIEKYLGVFRDVLAQRDSTYLDLHVGYDWCCAYVYFIMKQAGYQLSISPLRNSNWMLGNVKTWYDWAIQEQRFIEVAQEPEPGDLVLFDRLIEPVELDHIGIILESSADCILTSEGNYYNRAGIFKRKRDTTIHGYIRL